MTVTWTFRLVIPPDFQRQIKNGTGTIIQIFLDGVDANTAGIASGYLSQMLDAFDQTLPPKNHNPPSPIITDVDFVYNPGLVSSWFFVPGVMGLRLDTGRHHGGIICSNSRKRIGNAGAIVDGTRLAPRKSLSRK